MALPDEDRGQSARVYTSPKSRRQPCRVCGDVFLSTNPRAHTRCSRCRQLQNQGINPEDTRSGKAREPQRKTLCAVEGCELWAQHRDKLCRTHFVAKGGA